MLAQHDEHSARNRLALIEFLKQRIRRRTTGTTFRSEQFDENGMSLRARSIRRGRIAVATCHPTNHEPKNANAND
jgi:hypothetical protein